MAEIYDLRINNQKNPIGIERIEEIGWKIHSDRRNVRQKSYEIQIAKDSEFRSKIFDSGVINSGNSVHITMEKENIYLISSECYYVRVRAEVIGEGKSNWKEGKFVTAFLDKKEWKAEFISPEKENALENSRGYYLRKEFCLSQKVKKAYAYTTALGLYHFYLNGEKIGEDEFTPGWTAYSKHLLYQIYDVTDSLKNDRNMVGAVVGSGWYKTPVRFKDVRSTYEDRTAFLCQIEIEYENGERETILTDLSWECTESPILFSEIYDGETYDARLEKEEWNREKKKEDVWEKPEIIAFNKNALTAQSGCKVKEIERISAKRIFETPKGELVIDFGQNLAGWVEFKVKGKQGDIVELRCFEVLDKDGNVYRDNLRTAKQTIIYICGDDKEHIYHPYFSYQGFQYVQIASYPGEAEPEDFTACVIHSDMERTGKFFCSNELVNQLHHNILWGMKGNFLDVPTDCPQRDERLGWTGDAQIFCRTASYLMDTDVFFRKWLTDVKADQTEEGGIPHVVPDIYKGKDTVGNRGKLGTDSAAGWADAVVIIPWTLYKMYGDIGIIKVQYQSMKSWIDFMHAHSKDNMWKYKRQFGDWVALDAKEGSYEGATPVELTNMAYYAYSTGLFAKMAKLIGKQEEAEKYEALYKEIKDSYKRHYFTPEGRMSVQTQTAQILSLSFDLVPEKYKENVVNDLLALLEKEKGHLVTGFMGTPYFCQVLSENGHTKEAYELLLKEDYPSWLYQVEQGATTIWEHWDGKKPDGTMWSSDMNSFNHYAYGAVGEWLYRQVAGIECSGEAGGFQKIEFVPRIETFDFAGASYESVYGKIVSKWRRDKDKVYWEVEVPCNTSAVLYMYEAKEIVVADGLKFAKNSEGYKAETGSGNYKIVYKI